MNIVKKIIAFETVIKKTKISKMNVHFCIASTYPSKYVTESN